MKKHLLSLGILATAATFMFTQQSSIKDIAKDMFNSFNTDPVTVTFRIPILANPNTGFIQLDSTRVDLNMDQVIKDATDGVAGIDDADKIFIHSISLQLNNADNANNWANFTKVGSAMTSNTASTPIDMGSKENMPDTYSTELTLDVQQSVQMKDYLKGNTIYYVLYGDNRRATTKELNGTASIVFHVE